MTKNIVSQKDFTDLEKLAPSEEKGVSYHIDKITDNIFLGDLEGSKEFDYFSKEKINNVLSLVDNPPQYSEDKNINHKIVKIDDLFSENIMKYFKECIEFIDKADKVYIHCTCGVSRSATIVCAYLIWKTHSNFNDVYKFIKKRRPEIDPNNGFRRQLQLFHKLLEENNYDLNTINFNSI